MSQIAPDEDDETFDDEETDDEIEEKEETPTGRVRSKPFTKTEPVPDWVTDVPAGYTLAYTRSRVKTGVFRADDKSHWLVKDFRDGSEHRVANTKDARTVTNRLVADYTQATKDEREAARAARAAEKAAAAAEKATAVVA